MMSGGLGTAGLSASLPAGAVLGVVQLNAHAEQLLADLVGAGEVTPVPRGLPLGDQPIDLGIDHLRELDDVQDAIRVSQHRHRAGALLWRRLSRLEPSVEGLDELEKVTDRRG